MELHERLTLARKLAGFETAVEAAEALGVKYGTYAGHENGSSGFRADKGELYARRFKVRFEWLMRENGPMTDEESALYSDFLELLKNASEEARSAALTTLRLGQRREG
jgi:hypothetical protein